MDVIVGIGEYAVSDNCDDVLKTFALSSCVAITVYSKTKKAAGMVHIALPTPPASKIDSIKKPCYYATTAIPLIINKMYHNFGCKKDELEIHIFGGADSIRNNDVFNIGQKNIIAVKKTLFYLNIKRFRSQTGGTNSRTLRMEVETGKITVDEQPIKI